MSEHETNEPTPASDKPVKNIEVIHYPEEDVVLNNDADLAIWGPRLAELMHDGIPRDWESIDPESQELAYMGEVEGHRFLAKVKRYAGKDKLDRIKVDRAEGLENDYKAVYAGMSVLSELSNSPLVKTTIDSEEAQAAAKAAGFESISYVEPILATVDRQTGRKVVVYDFIEATASLWDIKEHTSPSNRQAVEQKNLQLLRSLIELLEKNGITPEDLASRHILRDDNDNLFLIDAEFYSRNRRPNEN